MSLKVWLPLNGDLSQYGASQISVTNNGSLVNIFGKIGRCYNFHGSTDYISLVGTELFQIFTGGTQQFSIAMWVYHTDNTRAILFGDYNTSGAINFNIELSAEHAVRFYWNGSPDFYPSNANVGASTWAHIALTYNGSKIQSYVNGIERGSWSGTLSPKNKTSGEFRLGRDSRSDSTALYGKLNDVRIYDHCLSAAEVREISQGLVLHYKLDNISNGIQDSSGYNNNGTTLNTVTTSTDTPRYTLSTSLPNGNSMINCGRGGMVTDSITVNFWCKYSSWGNPVSCTEGGGWNMENNGGSITFPVYLASIGYVHSINGAGAISLPPANYANSWHMFTGIYNRAEKTVSLYVDGELKQQNIASAGNNIAYHGSNCIWIGAEATGSNTTASNGMAGLFSDFRIYCTALDADAIRQLYELGAKIDNKQNLHTFELIENQSSIKVTKQGQVKCDDLTEATTTKFYKSKDINTNNLIEL